MASTFETYAFRDLVGSFSHPLAGTFRLSGGYIGLGTITVSKSTVRTTHATAADGTVMVSYVAGDSGLFTIECQQTSNLQAFLLSWYNLITTAANNGDASTWAAATVSFTYVNDGSSHLGTGVSPEKTPDKPYAAQGGNVTWHLMAASLISQ
jgi:structural protein KPP10_ORF10